MARSQQPSRIGLLSGILARGTGGLKPRFPFLSPLHSRCPFVGRFQTALARISHQVLDNAKPMSSREAVMRARKAKPRPGGVRKEGNGVSVRDRVFPHDQVLTSPRPGAVLPQPGFPVHPSGGQKSGLWPRVWIALKRASRGDELAREAKPADALRRPNSRVRYGLTGTLGS